MVVHLNSMVLIGKHSPVMTLKASSIPFENQRSIASLDKTHISDARVDGSDRLMCGVMI